MKCSIWEKNDKKYLHKLIKQVLALRNKVDYQSIDLDKCEITYMATKNQSFIGIRSGYAEQLLRMEKGIKESHKIRSNCGNYLKIYRNTQGQILQIESFVHGKMDCLYQSYYKDNVCYFFPYWQNGSKYPTYSFVTQYKNNKVVEEYLVDGSQIIYEKYSNESETSVDYYLINYIKGGKYPILEEKKGIIKFQPFSYKIIESDSWLNHRK
ncbi:MAG: hypothetical protein RR585_05785 [Coprobacillus sp.]